LKNILKMPFTVSLMCTQPAWILFSVQANCTSHTSDVHKPHVAKHMVSTRCIMMLVAEWLPCRLQTVEWNHWLIKYPDVWH
jgi:hypothetical protein